MTKDKTGGRAFLSVNTTISKEQLNQAVADWLEKQGLGVTSSFNVTVKEHAGDRPFDTGYTEITLSGVMVSFAARNEGQDT